MFTKYTNQFAVAVILLVAMTSPAAAETWELSSPQNRLHVKVEERDGIWYRVSLGDQEVIVPSQVDLKVKGLGWLARPGEPARATTESKTETVEFTVPRKYRKLETAYNQLTMEFKGGARLVFRAYDEGVAYRWETNFSNETIIEDELAEFRFPGDPQIWFPEEESIFTHQERVYLHLPLKEINSERFGSTGMLVKLADNRKVFISESDLRSYPGMFLRGVGKQQAGLVGKYAPYPLETKAQDDRNVPVTKGAPYLAKTVGTRTFPWRAMIITDNDAQLLQSELIYQLAPPLAIDDPSWIQPGKVAWDWWNGIDLTGVDFRAGVNTATYKYFIDFAADHDIEYILLDEGWTKSTDDILHEHADVNLEEILAYGKEKGVRVILWVLWNALDGHLDEALTRFEKMGVAGIKVDFIQRDDQWMMEYYERVAREAAKHHLMVDFHGACKPTGLNRPYPNVMTSEGVNGLEQYKWGDQKANPEQELVYPFTRMVAGPLDYTPGAMVNANRESYRWNVDHPMSLGTRCHQLAMYVIYESPLQMLADSPTRYRKEPECMKFLSAVPTVWNDTKVLDAKVEDYAVMARRSGDDWFIGAMNDWERRKFDVTLDFLPKGEYELQLWRDGINADRNGQDFVYETKKVSSGETLPLELTPGGGWVGWLRPVSKTTAGSE